MTAGTWIGAARRVVETSTAANVDGTLLDLFTASHLVTVHDGLSVANRARFAAMPLPAAADLAFRLLERVTR